MKQLEFYYDESVGFGARRLGYCFNVAAECRPKAKAEIIVNEGVALYQASTGKTDLPTLSKDEEIYLRLQFIKMAAKMWQGKDPGWSTLTEELGVRADQIEKEAKAKGLVFKS